MKKTLNLLCTCENGPRTQARIKGSSHSWLGTTHKYQYLGQPDGLKIEHWRPRRRDTGPTLEDFWKNEIFGILHKILRKSVVRNGYLHPGENSERRPEDPLESRIWTAVKCGSTKINLLGSTA